MYYRPRGERQFVVYLLVVLLALVIGLLIGAAYPDAINNFFPSVSKSIGSYFNRLVGSAVEASSLLEETETPEKVEVTTVPTPTETPVPLKAGSELLPPRPTPQTCLVETGLADGTINIRSGPGHTYAVIGTAREGDVLTFTGEENEEGWAPILTADGLSGYFFITSWCK